MKGKNTMNKYLLSTLLSVGFGALGAVSAYADVLPPRGLGEFKRKVSFTIGYNGANPDSAMPVLVKLSANSPSGFDYSSCASGGNDIRFMDSHGNAIPFEIDTWDTSGESLIWVRVPSVAQGTTFTMLFSGNPAVANTPSAVWSDYSGVWHLNDLGTDMTQHSQGSYPNSTAATGIDGHLSLMSIPDEAGRFGKSFRVNDSADWNNGNFNEGGVWVNDVGADSPLDGNSVFTISGWFKHQNWHYNYDKMFFKRPDEREDDQGSFVSLIGSNNYDPKVAARGSKGSDNGFRVRLDSATEMKAHFTNNWVYVTFVFDNRTCSIYENGALCKSGTTVAATDNDYPLVFGNNTSIASGASGNQAWNGWIDEVRLLKSAKSADWIAAEYAAMAGESFVTAGTVEKINLGTLLIFK